MISELDYSNSFIPHPRVSGSMPTWVPNNTKSGTAFRPEDCGGDHQIQRRLSSLPSFYPNTAFEQQPFIGSMCPTCGQNTVCSSCGHCHYCDDVDLPCASAFIDTGLMMAVTQIDLVVMSSIWYLLGSHTLHLGLSSLPEEKKEAVHV